MYILFQPQKTIVYNVRKTTVSVTCCLSIFLLFFSDKTCSAELNASDKTCPAELNASDKTCSTELNASDKTCSAELNVCFSLFQLFRAGRT